MENEQDVEDIENTSEEPELNTGDEVETIEDVKARLAQVEADKAKAEEIAENQRIRAEKAERNAKAPVKQEPKATAKQEELSTKDVIALAKANIADEDIDEVLEYARFKNISVQDALNSNVVKVTLSEKADMRKTAEATNTTGAKRVNAQLTDDLLLSRASKGELPESDAELERLIKARRT